MQVCQLGAVYSKQIDHSTTAPPSTSLPNPTCYLAATVLLPSSNLHLCGPIQPVSDQPLRLIVTTLASCTIFVELRAGSSTLAAGTLTWQTRRVVATISEALAEWVRLELSIGFLLVRWWLVFLEVFDRLMIFARGRLLAGRWLANAMV